jgi:peptide/nickel transport system permease protein
MTTSKSNSTELAALSANAPGKKKPRSLRLTTTAWIGILILLFWIIVAVFAPILAPFDEGNMVSLESFKVVEESSFLGTDYLGRDLLSRIIYGARMTLGLALIATLLSFSTGIVLGFVAAISRGWVDQVLSRAVDAIMAFPSIMLALIIIGGVGTSLPVLILTVAMIDATRVFRLSRALALDASVMDYVKVAEARGEGVTWIMLHEILPNTIVPLAAEFGIRYTFAILFISSLSFLGLGVQPPIADWGVMVKENLQGLLYGAPAALLPAASIATVSVAVNLLVDWLLHRSSATIPEELMK